MYKHLCVRLKVNKCIKKQSQITFTVGFTKCFPKWFKEGTEGKRFNFYTVIICSYFGGWLQLYGHILLGFRSSCQWILLCSSHENSKFMAPKFYLDLWCPLPYLAWIAALISIPKKYDKKNSTAIKFCYSISWKDFYILFKFFSLDFPYLDIFTKLLDNVYQKYSNTPHWYS